MQQRTLVGIYHDEFLQNVPTGCSYLRVNVFPPTVGGGGGAEGTWHLSDLMSSHLPAAKISIFLFPFLSLVKCHRPKMSWTVFCLFVFFFFFFFSPI